MAYYRLYSMDARSGHIVGVWEIEAAADEDAITAAAQKVASQPLELWCKDRKVRRFEADSDAPPSRVMA